MRIDINEKYCITSDPNQFIINTKGTIKTNRKGTGEKPGAKAGDEYLTPVAYLPESLDDCAIWLARRMIRESDAIGFKAVIAEQRRIEKELKEVIKI